MPLFLIFTGPVIACNTTGMSEFTHCYDFGCKSTQQIDCSDQQWTAIKEIFAQPTLSPWLEKQQIRRAIGKMEEFSEQIAGNYHDNTVIGCPMLSVIGCPMLSRKNLKLFAQGTDECFVGNAFQFNSA